MRASALGSGAGGGWPSAACASPTTCSSWTTSARATWSRWGASSGRARWPWTPSTRQVSPQRRPGSAGGKGWPPPDPPCPARSGPVPPRPGSPARSGPVREPGVREAAGEIRRRRPPARRDGLDAPAHRLQRRVPRHRQVRGGGRSTADAQQPPGGGPQTGPWRVAEGPRGAGGRVWFSPPTRPPHPRRGRQADRTPLGPGAGQAPPPPPLQPGGPVRRFLLSRGADREVANDDGDLPADLIDPDFKDLVQLFQGAGVG